VVLELNRGRPLQTPNSAGAASLCLQRNSAPERRSSGVLEPFWSNSLRGKSCFWEKSRAEVHRTDATFTKLNVKTNFLLKINVIWKFFELQIYPTKTSVSLLNLVRLSL
jgi:hypothetical protein